ncbi:MAG: proton-conducting transporter membrane subunit [Capsulimonadaceae bacterium]
MILFVILVLPLIAAILSWFVPSRKLTPAVTLLCAIATLTMVVHVAREVSAGRPVVGLVHWLAVDGLSAVVVLLVAWVGALAALFSWGYIDLRHSDIDRVKVYYTNFNGFLFALLLVPSLEEPNLVWMAVELTALFSVLLVAHDNSQVALEAAWKYIALMFMGAAIALMGFLILFWAFQLGGGVSGYSWAALRLIAPHMAPALVNAAFLFILVGFGAKAGIVPMLTWIPDAYSQAPSPVCAMLSGLKTTVIVYVFLRLLPLFPHAGMNYWLIVVGLASVCVAALLLVWVQDYKRLFAYSTVEHTGIVLTAAGLGTAASRYALLMQMVSHSITKSFCFFAAGAVVLLTKTREIAGVRGCIRVSPGIGAALVFGGLAIAGAPPMAVFLSEFSIVRAGLEDGQFVIVGLLAIFIVIAFVGMMRHVNKMVFAPPADTGTESEKFTLPLSCRLALILAAVPVLVLGVYIPRPLDVLFQMAASALTR